jgi:hypothetical protein
VFLRDPLFLPCCAPVTSLSHVSSDVGSFMCLFFVVAMDARLPCHAPPPPAPAGLWWVISMAGLPPPDDEVCEVCRTGDSEPGNQIVFCDGEGCKVAVHQECYGVVQVPEGDWLCATCAAGRRPGTTTCVLCPVRGGAMKAVVDPTPVVSSQSAHKNKRVSSRDEKWAHVACATWVPEVYFGDEASVDLVSVRGVRSHPCPRPAPA